MAFSSFVFLFIFFPLAVLLYFLPGRAENSLTLRRKLILLGLSLVFYAWGEPLRIVLLILSILLNYLLLRGRQKVTSPLKRKVILVTAVLLNLAVLAWGKYGAPTIPLGLSFYTFKLLSAWFDSGRHRQEPVSFLDFALYISFFPQLISGPIERFDDFMPQLKKLEADTGNLAEGLQRFLPGLFVKLIVADSVYGLWLRLAGPEAPAPGLLEAWLASFLYTFYIYLDFSSYSDMAIGLGKIFGLKTKENFERPYRALSVSDFWRRWHISLSSWFRDYVYIPLGGNRRGKKRQILNIFIVWLLTGIWHGSSLNFVLWGLYYALWLLLEKFILSETRAAKKAPEALRRLLTFLIVNFGWVLFAFPKTADLKNFSAALFGAGGLSNGMAAYLVSAHTVLLIAAVLLSADLLHSTVKRIRQMAWTRTFGAQILHYVLYALMLLLSLSYIVDQSFASFLYFKF